MKSDTSKAPTSIEAYRWLMTNRLFGKRFSDYRERRGATWTTKLVSVGTLILGMGASVLLIGPPLWVDALLAAVAVAVTWHLLALKTIHD